MARSRRIDPRIWSDSKFAGLNDDSKLLFFYFLTHPHMTAIGGIRVTISGMTDELKWTSKRLHDAIAGLDGLVVYYENLLVVLPNFLKYNTIENPNQCKAAVEQLLALPECEGLNTLWAAVKPFTDRYKVHLPNPPEITTTSKQLANTRNVSKKQAVRAPPGFVPPTVEEVAAYCDERRAYVLKERKRVVDPQAWHDHYSSVGWRVGSNPMKDWKAAVRTWESYKDKRGRQDESKTGSLFDQATRGLL